MSAPPPLRLLASVRDAREALLARSLGADIIDLKEPAAGALGAVPPEEQLRVLAALGPQRPQVSATVGDLPLEAVAALAAAIQATAARGVDIVKFGVFAGGDAALAALDALDRRLQDAGVPALLVPVLLADRLRDAAELEWLAVRALTVRGVAGVMLDTAGKVGVDASARRLTQIFTAAQLQGFVALVQAAGGLAGLAGALRAEDIALAAASGADLLGFRSALCAGGRAGALDEAAFARVRLQMCAASADRKATALPSKTSVVARCGALAANSG